MSDPLRTSSTAGPANEAEGVDREARIEQLLLAGLDQYFAGQYEQAIDIWTRVAFLERRHGRARAYIDRARSALAERQRESEELLHQGVAEYHAGRLDSARELLTRAVEQGGPSDTALVFLQHLGRVEPAAHAARREASGAGVVERTARSERLTASEWIVTSVVSLGLAGFILLASRPIASFFAEWPVDAASAAAPTVEPLPIVRSSDMVLARARQLHETGRSREALRVLDTVDVSDPARTQADRLRAEIQRALLATVVQPASLPPSGVNR